MTWGFHFGGLGAPALGGGPEEAKAWGTAHTHAHPHPRAQLCYITIPCRISLGRKAPRLTPTIDHCFKFKSAQWGPLWFAFPWGHSLHLCPLPSDGLTGLGHRARVLAPVRAGPSSKSCSVTGTNCPLRNRTLLLRAPPGCRRPGVPCDRAVSI